MPERLNCTKLIDPFCTTRLVPIPKLVLAKLLLTKVSALGGAWANSEGEARTNHSRLKRLVGIWRIVRALGMVCPLPFEFFLRGAFSCCKSLLRGFQGNRYWGRKKPLELRALYA